MSEKVARADMLVDNLKKNGLLKQLGEDNFIIPRNMKEHQDFLQEIQNSENEDAMAAYSKKRNMELAMDPERRRPGQ